MRLSRLDDLGFDDILAETTVPVPSFPLPQPVRLPKVNVPPSQLAWRAEAACDGMDADLFFPKFEYDRRNSETARAVCAGCPVRLACLEWAQEHCEIGIWGGTTTRERQRMRRDRRRIAV